MRCQLGIADACQWRIKTVFFVDKCIDGNRFDMPGKRGHEACQLGFVDDAAASGIDQYRALAHQPELGKAEQALGERCQRYVDRNHVGLAQQLFEGLPSLKPKATRDLLRKTL